MMDVLIQVIVTLALLIGSLFSILGVLGYLRFPDVYTRLHATGKVGVFGAVFLLIAAMVWTPSAFGKGLVIIIMILLSGPVTAHAFASAAYRIGIPMDGLVRDELRKDQQKQN
jgi:multicomponent Na+:H+ antiporter subunit G